MTETLKEEISDAAAQAESVISDEIGAVVPAWRGFSPKWMLYSRWQRAVAVAVPLIAIGIGCWAFGLTLDTIGRGLHITGGERPSYASKADLKTELASYVTRDDLKAEIAKLPTADALDAAIADLNEIKTKVDAIESKLAAPPAKEAKFPKTPKGRTGSNGKAAKPPEVSLSDPKTWW